MARKIVKSYFSYKFSERLGFIRSQKSATSLVGKADSIKNLFNQKNAQNYDLFLVQQIKIESLYQKHHPYVH